MEAEIEILSGQKKIHRQRIQAEAMAKQLKEEEARMQAEAEAELLTKQNRIAWDKKCAEALAKQKAEDQEMEAAEAESEILAAQNERARERQQAQALAHQKKQEMDRIAAEAEAEFTAAHAKIRREMKQAEAKAKEMVRKDSMAESAQSEIGGAPPRTFFSTLCSCLSGEPKPTDEAELSPKSRASPHASVEEVGKAYAQSLKE
jgi:membrane protein involved in colicin uptake